MRCECKKRCRLRCAADRQGRRTPKAAPLMRAEGAHKKRHGGNFWRVTADGFPVPIVCRMRRAVFAHRSGVDAPEKCVEDIGCRARFAPSRTEGARRCLRSACLKKRVPISTLCLPAFVIRAHGHFLSDGHDLSQLGSVYGCNYTHFTFLSKIVDNYN